MNAANKITTARVALIPVMITVFYLSDAWGGIAASAVFIVASLTDLIDGRVARRRGEVSEFGKLYDPLVDKLLSAAALVLLLDAGGLGTNAGTRIAGAVCAAAVIIREFAVDLIRQYAAAKGKVIAANVWGKVKTAVLTFALAVLLFSAARWYAPSETEFADGVRAAGLLVFYAAAGLSVLSFVIYASAAKKVFKADAPGGGE